MTTGRVLFAVMMVLYAMLYLLRVLDVYIPVVSDYLADLLALPVILTISRFLMIKFKVVNPSFEINLWMVLLTATYVSLVFEWWLPPRSERYTSDLVDVMAYFLGAIAYYLYRRSSKSTPYADKNS
ncbi:MAG: hypothetical protein EA392_09150 [Cryomorphaceae bacterium]|nr:MAG: hypothetical protein EA392_09150 [Cryomorphaceae bacterium]